MPILDKPGLDLSGCPNSKLWRYMDWPKFLSILVNRALFFPSIRTLRDGDPYEGKPTLADRLITWEDLGPLEREFYGGQKQMFEVIHGHLDPDLQDISFASCWYLGEDESAAMWTLYASQHSGIAVQSTVGRLRSVVQPHPNATQMGPVRYVDRRRWVSHSGWIDVVNWQKHVSYAHEQEIRVIITEFDSNNVVLRRKDGVGVKLTEADPSAQYESMVRTDQLPGLNVQVSPETLIEAVYVSPLSPSWGLTLVERVRNQLGYSFEVRPSELRDGLV